MNAVPQSSKARTGYNQRGSDAGFVRDLARSMRGLRERDTSEFADLRRGQEMAEAFCVHVAEYSPEARVRLCRSEAKRLRIVAAEMAAKKMSQPQWVCAADQLDLIAETFAPGAVHTCKVVRDGKLVTITRAVPA